MSRLPRLGPRGEGWLAIQILLFWAVIATSLLGPAWDGAPRTLSTITGLVLLAGGLVLAVRGVADLGRAFTPLPHPRPDARLVQTGVYSLVRHPIYGGVVIAALGWGLLTACTRDSRSRGRPPRLLRAEVAPRGDLARRALPGLPRLPGADAAAHPLDRLSSALFSSRMRRSIASRNGSVTEAGSVSRTESLTPYAARHRVAVARSAFGSSSRRWSGSGSK